MELIDRDGDRIEFYIDGITGKLKEYVNGKLEIPEIKTMRYSMSEGTITDETGVFQIAKEEQIEKALGLHALALRAGVLWEGDEPAPANELLLTDTDGDKLEFVLLDGKLQELNNGQVEIREMRKLTFKYSEGLIIDDTGEFHLPKMECIQKAAALRSLAEQAGIQWEGDEPSEKKARNFSNASTGVLDIENCASDWEFQCPKNWSALTETGTPNEHFCNTCKETVYFCETEEQLREHTKDRRCVAFDLQESSLIRTESDGIDIRVVMLNGDELQPMPHLATTKKVSDLKKLISIAPQCSIPIEEQKLFLEERELVDGNSLAEEGVASDVSVQLVRVQIEKPKHEPRMGPRRMMGKRRPQPMLERLLPRRD